MHQLAPELLLHQAEEGAVCIEHLTAIEEHLRGEGIEVWYDADLVPGRIIAVNAGSNYRTLRDLLGAARERPGLQKIGERFNANVKVVEVPPGPPVQAPIVAEIYGPEAQGRRDVAKAVRARFDKTTGIVDVDDSSIAAAPKTLLLVDRRKAAMLGVPQDVIVNTLRTGLAGEATSYLHDETKYPAAATLRLPAEQQGDLDTLLQLGVRSSSGISPRAP